MKNQIYPKISIILNMNNGGRTLEEFFKLLFSQNYPINKIEIVIADGGCKENTKKIINNFKKKYPKNIKIVLNKKKYKLGRGMGADIASRNATGDMILMVDSDNLLIQKDWLKNMVKILLENRDIHAVQSGLLIPKKASIIDKYFGAIGIEDPFSIPYSLGAQVIFNPQMFEYNKRGDFYIYEADKDNFYYFGDNGFLIWKNYFFKNDGYTQDIDNSYRMAKSKRIYRIAVTKKLKIYHKSPTKLIDFLKKKGLYVRIYLQKNYENRDFYWFSLKYNNFKQNLKFINSVLYNLLFILYIQIYFIFRMPS